MTILQTTAEWAIFLSIVFMVLCSIWESDKGKKAVLEGRKSKVRVYQEAMLFLWLPTLLLLIFLATGAFTSEQLGLVWKGTLPNWVGLGFSIVVVGYFLLSLNRLATNAKERGNFRKAISENQNWILPSTPSELGWFTLGLSVSAGVCEELLFRGFIIGALGNHLGVIGSLLLGSALFGLCHFYQGWASVLRTALVGLALGIIYILSDTLWVVILLHVTTDIYGGLVGYILHKSEPENSRVNDVATVSSEEYTDLGN